MGLLKEARQIANPPVRSRPRRPDLEWVGRQGSELMVHFAGAPANIYQLRPWLAPMAELHRRHRLLIVTQNPDTHVGLRQLTNLPIASAPNTDALDRVVAGSDFKLALYISHHSGNFRNMRHSDMLHVSIGHGESDKLYMASNQAKSYDYVLVAGQAGVERYRRRLINLDESKFVQVGRPQLDFATACLAASDRPTVLYAPTWEGDRPTMRYSSVPTYGVDLMAQLLDPAHGFRVVFRPHPFTGKEDRDTAKALRKMRSLLGRAQNKHPLVGHVEDNVNEFTSLALGADLLIADNSAVLVDFLATGKPYMVAAPEALEAEVPTGGAAQAGYQLDRGGVLAVADQVRRILAEDKLRDQRMTLAAHYYGDTTPGASMQRFAEAVELLLAKRDSLIEARAAATAP